MHSINQHSVKQFPPGINKVFWIWIWIWIVCANSHVNSSDRNCLLACLMISQWGLTWLRKTQRYTLDIHGIHFIHHKTTKQNWVWDLKLGLSSYITEKKKTECWGQQTAVVPLLFSRGVKTEWRAVDMASSGSFGSESMLVRLDRMKNHWICKDAERFTWTRTYVYIKPHRTFSSGSVSLQLDCTT